MKAGTQAAVAVGIGYLLGRRKRLRRAAVLAGVVATGSAGGLSKALLGRGLKAVGSTELLGKLTPELGEIADTARTELVDAGKTAAMALVTNRVESLSDSLRSRADGLRDPAATGGDAVEKLRGGGRTRRSEQDEPDDDRDNRRSGRSGQDEDQYDEYDEYEADENGYEDEDDTADTDDFEPEDDEFDRDEEEADEDEPAPAPRRRTRVTSSPVSRAGR